MSDNIRIKTTPGGGEKRVNIDINQKFDFIEILSLKISQDEAYRRFCSDYGVVVGRVIVNNGLGVPNAKVSIFIPVEEADLEDPEISGLYPYEITTDTDSDGIPYNLVPRNNRGKDDCFTPIGTFPGKREIQDNPEIAELYCKYYKFTTTTNESGDFMFFGVPVGTHFMHVDADVSDIGILSQRPYDLIRDGANEKSFKSPTKFKNRKESTTLNQLKTTTPMSVTVPPFWGDTEQCQVGIARADINLATTITPSAIFMGSLVSDNDKHALSRTCVPRKKLGKMDELVTGEGRIEMIRKTPDGGIERFDVEGGQVIDENGTWAYQIPMNTDYMVTAEDGTLVPSGDPTRGIPTKARVRFRIGMNIQGDEGRLRTRAKYLVPHNPDTWSETDFTFGTTTSDKHFTELSWNKIYTVKNHITRVQPRGGAENRNFIGFKNVDDSGDKNPIPFNKLDNDLNPLFTILCVLIQIIARIVGIINSLIIPLINGVIFLLNVVLRLICNILHNIVGLSICALQFRNNSNCRSKYCIGTPSGKKCDCKDILSYIPYITLKCSANENGYEYAPGGRKGGGYKLSYEATLNKKDPDGNPVQTPFHYVNDGTDGTTCDLIQRASIQGCDAGWSRCQSANLADALDVFKFDFYNDWINGVLYPFLLKYKVKKRGTGRERFCEVECDDFPGGVDNDKKNGSDNPCKTNYIVDTCTGAVPQGNGSNRGVNSDERIKIRSGYIKKYEKDNELYYTPISRDGDNKLFATDIISLGSVFDCDWEGKPRFYQYLVDTTFNLPPLVSSYDLNIDGTPATKQVSGIISDKVFTKGLIGDLTCLGLNTDSDSCNNLKRLCELGVGLDELRVISSTGVVLTPDNKITNADVESDFVRGIFTTLNTPGTTAINPVFIDNAAYPDYQDTPYTNFRVDGGIRPSNSSFWNRKIWVYDSSYYFYFGLNKGRTALSKMMQKYFTECTPEEDVDFYVVSTQITEDTAASTGDGSIDIAVIGGVGPYTFLWSNGPTVNGQTYPITNNTQNISGLYGGTYTVEVTDSSGNVTSATFIVPGPTPVSCNVQTVNTTSNGASNGEIIVGVSNGVPPYKIELNKYDATTTTGTILGSVSPSPISGLPGGYTFTNLQSGTYIVRVTDSGTPETTCQSIDFIGEPAAIDVTLTGTDPSCANELDGSITTTISGGIAPYTYLWSPGGETSLNLNNLAGNTTYTLTVRDDNGNGAPVTKSTTLGSPPLITTGTITTSNGNCGSGPSRGTITIPNIQGGSGSYTVELTGGDNDVNISQSANAGDTILFNNLDNGAKPTPYVVTITDSNGCDIRIEDIEVFVPSTPLSVGISSNGATPATLTATISGGIFNTNPLDGDTYDYVVTLQRYNGSSWDNVTSSTISSGSFSYTLASNTGSTYRYFVRDKSGQTGSCSAISTTTVA